MQDGGAALRKAAEDGDLPTVKALLARGAQIDDGDKVMVAGCIL